METTVGQLLVNEALPENLRDHSRVLDKGGVKRLLDQLEQEVDPETYKDVIYKLHHVGSSVAQSSGASLSLNEFTPPKAIQDRLVAMRQQVVAAINDDSLTDEQRDSKIKEIIAAGTPNIDKDLVDSALKEGSQLAIQVHSGSRGGPADMRSMLLGDFLVEDHKGNVIPIPMLTGYASGVSPAEYWAGAYGARKGTISTKFATQRAGFFGKQMIQAAHRLVVTEADCSTDRGIPVDATDPDNAGSVLATTVGDIPAGTVLTPRIMHKLHGHKIMVRSPMTCQAAHGVCQRCTGVRDRGGFPDIGDNAGVDAATALTEQLSQSMLNVKHTGGRARLDKLGKDSLGGYDLINQLVEVPTHFREAATLAQYDGSVSQIAPAAGGGFDVHIGTQVQHVPANVTPTVKVGDVVEAGDALSSGIPNPAELVQFKGVGAGRFGLMNQLRKAYTDSGLKAHRRNLELLVRGLVNHVRINQLDGPEGTLPDDMVEYNQVERGYEPRYGARTAKPRGAIGMFLEKPAAQYSIGTRVTKSVAEDLYKNGVPDILVHKDEPSFQPEMVRAMESLTYAPDWQVRMGGSFLRKGLLEAVHRGRSSAEHSESYIPALARGSEFGKDLRTTGKY